MIRNVPIRCQFLLLGWWTELGLPGIWIFEWWYLGKLWYTLNESLSYGIFGFTQYFFVWKSIFYVSHQIKEKISENKNVSFLLFSTVYSWFSRLKEMDDKLLFFFLFRRVCINRLILRKICAYCYILKWHWYFLFGKRFELVQSFFFFCNNVKKKIFLAK